MPKPTRKEVLAIERQLMIKYQRVFGTPDGKEVLLDLMNKNFFVNSTKDEREAGRRDALLDILKMRSSSIIKLYDEFINQEDIKNDGVG